MRWRVLRSIRRLLRKAYENNPMLVARQAVHGRDYILWQVRDWKREHVRFRLRRTRLKIHRMFAMPVD